MWNPSSCSHGSDWESHPWFQQQLQMRPKAREGKVNPRLARVIGDFFSHATPLMSSSHLSLWARAKVYWNQGNYLHGLKMYCKSCGSYSLFLNGRFFLEKIYDSILQCYAKMDKLPHVCKALFLTWKSIQKSHNILSQPKTSEQSEFSRNSC